MKLPNNFLLFLVFYILLFNSSSAQNQEIGSNYSFGFHPNTDRFIYDGQYLGNYAIGWYNTTGAAEARLSGFDGIKFFTGNQVRLNINKNGSVGILTSDPDAQLDVNGSVIFNQLTYSYTNLRIGHDTNDKIIADNSSTKTYGGGYFFRVTSDPSLNISSNYIDVMMLSDKGNVGIGTRTTGNHRLAVEGSIGAREIKVQTTGWSDFVFERNYTLPTLLEVENHIYENGHLKDIPSAKEVEENGIYLGEMDAKLLQKIEELTLYMIQINKEVDILILENKELKKKVTTLEKS